MGHTEIDVCLDRLLGTGAVGLVYNGIAGAEIGVVFKTHELFKLLEHGRAADRGHDVVSVLAHLNAGDGDDGVAVNAGALCLHSVVETVDEVVGLKAHEHLVLRNVDALALAGLAGAVHCDGGRPCREERGYVVAGVGLCGEGRCGLGLALNGEEAGEGLTDGVVGAAVDVGGVARLTVAGDVNDGQARVDLPKHLVGQTPLCPCAALGAFNENVGVRKELLEHLFALLGADVQCDGAVVAVLGPPDIADEADHVLCDGAFDLNDLGALLREESARHGACDAGAGADDLYALHIAEYGHFTAFHNIFSFFVKSDIRRAYHTPMLKKVLPRTSHTMTARSHTDTVRGIANL